MVSTYELHYILITWPFWRHEWAVCIIEIWNVILVDIDAEEYSSEEDHYTKLLPQRTHKLTDTNDEISSGFHADG